MDIATNKIALKVSTPKTRGCVGITFPGHSYTPSFLYLICYQKFSPKKRNRLRKLSISHCISLICSNK